MIQQTTFSIIIPTYNNLELFKRALNSILEQDYCNYEIIVTDDSVNNDIREYIDSLQLPVIKYYSNVPSLGAVRNWNKGLSMCNGEFVIIMHHDESVKDRDFLTRIHRKMQYTDVAICNVEVFNKNGSYTLAPHVVKKMMLYVPSLLFAFNCYGPCATVILRRSVIVSFDERLAWFVDIDWYYRLIKRNRTKYVKDLYIISHHGHKGQITSNIDILTVAKKDSKVLAEKYSRCPMLLLAVSISINVLQNPKIRRIIHKILGR